MDQQLSVAWPTLLDGIATMLNPIHDQLFQAYSASYYWSTFQSEWAIDLTFHTADDLHRLYPRLLQHAISTFGSTDVMRFLGGCRSAARSPHGSVVRSSAISASVRKASASSTV
jgi:hypothetical protein